jgi:hypothetical protein
MNTTFRHAHFIASLVCLTLLIKGKDKVVPVLN